MMNTEVAVVRPMMSVDITKIDYKALAARAERFAKKQGSGGGGGARIFPGTQITFKQGDWTHGYGDNASLLKAPSFVVNVANAVACWQTWDTAQNSDKRFPQYTDRVFLASGDDLPDREELGQTDESEWELDSHGKPQDPWKPVIVFPVRLEGESQIDHVMLTTPSSTGAAYNLFRTWAEQAPAHPGQLPIVEMGAETASRTITKKVRGKDVKEKQSWKVPKFDIVGWVDAEPCDNPGPGGVKVEEASDEIGEVETRTRTASKPETKALPAPAKTKAAEKAPPPPPAPVKGKQKRRPVDDLE